MELKQEKKVEAKPAEEKKEEPSEEKKVEAKPAEEKRGGPKSFKERGGVSTRNKHEPKPFDIDTWKPKTGIGEKNKIKRDYRNRLFIRWWFQNYGGRNSRCFNSKFRKRFIINWAIKRKIWRRAEKSI